MTGSAGILPASSSNCRVGFQNENGGTGLWPVVSSVAPETRRRSYRSTTKNLSRTSPIQNPAWRRI